MTNMSKTIVFFGTDTFSARALQSLIDANYRIGAVITKPDSKSGRGQHLTAPLVKQIAEAHTIPVWQPTKLTDIKESIEALGDVIGVLSSYGRIVPASIIELFSPGIVNIHPSLLPLYRGPSPIETVVANGDSKTGVSIMQLSAEMDAGPIYAQEVYSLNGTETAPELYDTLAALGGNLLTDVLPRIINGSVTPTPQPDGATYCSLLSKDDSTLDPATMTATQAERHVRAYIGYPKSKIALKGYPVIVTKAHVVSEQTEEQEITFSDGDFLAIDELVGPSGRKMSGEAFLNGHKL
jgi:methionyl-tRNA formyltransferase